MQHRYQSIARVSIAGLLALVLIVATAWDYVVLPFLLNGLDSPNTLTVLGGGIALFFGSILFVSYFGYAGLKHIRNRKWLSFANGFMISILAVMPLSWLVVQLKYEYASGATDETLIVLLLLLFGAVASKVVIWSVWSGLVFGISGRLDELSRKARSEAKAVLD